MSKGIDVPTDKANLQKEELTGRWI